MAENTDKMEESTKLLKLMQDQMNDREEKLKGREEKLNAKLEDVFAKLDQMQRPMGGRGNNFPSTSSNRSQKAQGSQGASGSQGTNNLTGLEKKPGESRLDGARRRLSDIKSHEDYRRFFRQIRRETIEDIALSNIYTEIGIGPFRINTCRFYNTGKCTKGPAHVENRNSPSIRAHFCELCANTRFVGLEHEMINCTMLSGLETEFQSDNTEQQDDDDSALL